MLKRTTAQQILEELKVGHTVFMLQSVDLSTAMPLADWMLEEFVVEVPEEDKPSKASKTQGGG